MSRQSKVITKNITALVLLILGVLSMISIWGTLIAMEGHLDSVIYMTRFFVAGILLLFSGILLKYIVIIK